ncbi:aminotransferase class V-fold PLP-dependent enzyme [Stackebrandtia nassauensis]|uniref:Cysteine desulfurase n=1 Tax=Stackebrandtia nassauensis (strain DSM 44728 / CIP 108903 / NRRL B-16338 / NBRC 102104 / LLR-40K-21) TaxID=446470 RepID=D3Q087_STANL|nr:aminotransferase class V-fold PLP-dependent enzyme [Stackebrandtia nassauensis]ADD45616.1 Cysteine desulfurase [Stackebrandtia nassauensis DSM 44728]
MATSTLINRPAAVIPRPRPLAELLPAAANRARELDVVEAPEVPLVDGTSTRYANFDYAASAPCIRAAADAVAELLPRYTAVHRGAGWLSRECTRSYEEARAAVGRFLGCRPDDSVVFTKHTTESLNLLARAVPEGTRVVVFDSEHHANLLPWTDPIRLPVPDSPATAVRSIVSALEVLGDEAPVLVAITGASNVTGELFPIAEVAVAARRFGARVVLDAAQLAPHRAIDIAALGVDYVAISGHKLYAPFGAGVLAGRSDWLDAADPFLAGGGATATVGDATCDITWKTGPARHEAGSPNVIGAVALGAVCEALSNARRSELVAREDALRSRLADGLSAIPGVNQLHIFGPDSDRVGTVAFTIDGLSAGVAAAALSAEYGIGVRDGLFCAHPLTRRLVGRHRTTAPSGCGGGEPASPQALRASIGLGTTEAEVDRLIAAVAELAAAGPAWNYAEVDGRQTPVPDPRVG